MEHYRSTSAGDERLHTSVIDHCCLSQGRQQGITVPVVKDMKNKGSLCLHGPVERSEYVLR